MKFQILFDYVWGYPYIYISLDNKPVFIPLENVTYSRDQPFHNRNSSVIIHLLNRDTDTNKFTKI